MLSLSLADAAKYGALDNRGLVVIGAALRVRVGSVDVVSGRRAVGAEELDGSVADDARPLGMADEHAV